MPAQQLQSATGGTSATVATNGPAAAPAVTQAGGNAAAQDKLKKVGGPIGRVWNHILGQPEGKTDTGDARVDQAMVRAYLDKRLGFAEGEFFRGAKLDGVSEKLVAGLDTDHDGKVSWPEFEAFEGQMLSLLAPGADKGADVGAAAGGQFGKVDSSGDKKADLGELQTAGQATLPKGTEHADLISQLGARVAIDAADKDEGTKPIGQRSLSRDEWTGAAAEMAARRK
jgi:hypothetical protein